MKNMNEKNMKCFKIVSWTQLQTFFFSYTHVLSSCGLYLNSFNSYCG